LLRHHDVIVARQPAARGAQVVLVHQAA
jgi:hypothetical protein